MGTLYGLLGETLGHSMSPEIHSLIFKELNINGYYHLFQVKKENLKEAVHGLKAVGAKGINVTIPYKVSIMDYLDELSQEAKQIRAINTIVFKNNKTLGYNTDYHGFGMMLKRNNIDITNKKAVILGSGGAAKAVLQYLWDHNIQSIKIVSRDGNKLKNTEHFKNFQVLSYHDLTSLKEEDIIINCTPRGMYPKVKDCPVDQETMGIFSVAIDLIYNPKETVFLKYAKQHGTKAINGWDMLVGQAIVAQELWHDIKMPKNIVDTIYHRFQWENSRKII